MKAWPFLITRNELRDFADVVIPDFIKQSGALEFTSRAAGDFLHGEGEAIYIKGNHETLGVIDVVFREVQGTERMLGKESAAVLRDRVGRPIRMFEGFVVRQRLPDGQLNLTKEQLDAAHNAVEPHFREFWNSGAHDWQTSASSGVMELPATGEKLHLHIHEPPIVQPPPLPVDAPEEAAKFPESVAKELHKPVIPEATKDLPKIGGKLNKLVVFSVVTGVALGIAYLAYRHFSKPKARSHGFAGHPKQGRDVADRSR